MYLLLLSLKNHLTGITLTVCLNHIHTYNRHNNEQFCVRKVNCIEIDVKKWQRMVDSNSMSTNKSIFYIAK